MNAVSRFSELNRSRNRLERDSNCSDRSEKSEMLLTIARQSVEIWQNGLQ